MISIKVIADQQEAIFGRLRARQRDLRKYNQTIVDLHRTDVSKDITYQRNFNGLYGVRRNQDWRTIYFALLEGHKFETEICFREILGSLHGATGRIEASFASKLIATVNPMKGVYDSFVRINFDLPARSGSSPARIEALCEDYIVIDHTLTAMCGHQVFPDLRRTFDDQFPEFTNFSDVKVLDLMVWQMR